MPNLVGSRGTPLEFASVTISFFIHSTEDSERLEVSICERLGLLREELSIERVEGHFGNEILSAKAHATGRRAQEVCSRIFGNLSSRSRLALIQDLDSSIDEHDALYLRVDRQSLDEEGLSLSDEEPIRIKLKPKFRAGGRMAMLSSYEELIK